MPPFDHLFWKSQPFQELKKAYAEHLGWSGLISWINLESDLSRVREKAQKVRLLTMHAAKGLEFEAVFIPALEQGIVPFGGKEILSGKPQPQSERPDQEEEKRLFYVAMTRAKSHLFLSTAAKRSLYGRQLQLQPSSFLSLLPWEGVHKFKNVSKTLTQEKQLNLL
jgi:superfamily I DNA/RNA helicase